MYSIFDEKDLTLSLSCASGVESVLKKELYRLGFDDAPAINGKIEVKGDALSLAKLNINIRTADRVYIKLSSYFADTFDALYDGTYLIPWENVISKNGRVIVNGKCVKSKLFAVSACQSIVKKAIAKRLCDKYKLESLEEDGEEYKVEFSVFKDNVEILLNTSGVGLHKRGYRDLVGIAPIKETLASALLLLSDFYYKRPFLDPFCGSGTIAIEGAKIALNIAPNLERDFDFLHYKSFDKKLYEIAINEARDKEERDRELEFFASDIDTKAIKLAKRHAERAGVLNKIRFDVKDVKDVKLRFPFGTVVTNPPYGERVYDKEEAEECYKSLGKIIKQNGGWSAFVITSAKNFEKCFGKKAERTRKLYNSNKECNFYYYYGKKGEKL